MYQPASYIVPIDAVEKQLSSIKISKAVGPDNLPNYILQSYSPILAWSKAAIVSSSLREGNVPTLWKSADICNLPKIPPKDISKDLERAYITDRSVLSKCAECPMQEWIMDAIIEDLDSHQFGSIKGSSTVLALL